MAGLGNLIGPLTDRQRLTADAPSPGGMVCLANVGLPGVLQGQAGCGSPSRGLYADDVNQMQFGEHADVLAILAGTATPQQASIIGSRLAEPDADVARCTLYFQFYRAMALTRLGQASAVWQGLDDWRRVLDAGLTTLPEYLDRPGQSSRSDCHAWSAWPMHWFLSGVLGVTPLQRGYQVIGLRPQLGPLTHAQGQVCTPQGPIKIHLHHHAGLWTLNAATPQGIPCQITLPDGQVIQNEGGEFTYQVELGMHLVDREDRIAMSWSDTAMDANTATFGE